MPATLTQTTQWTYPSSSSSAIYTTVLAADGKLMCDCKGWTIKKTGQARCCKHVHDVIAKHSLRTEERGDYLYVIDGKPPPPAAPAAAKAAPVSPVTDREHPKPMLASAMSEAVNGALFDANFARGGWVIEEKLDGHRTTVEKRADGSVLAYSRPRAGEAARRCALRPEIVAQFAHLAPGIYDGERCVPGGMSSDVVRLGAKVILVLFDVIEVGGRSLTRECYGVRREALLRELAKLPKGQSAISTVESLPPRWATIEAIWARGGEGVIVKREASTYQPGTRGPDWIKVKQSKSIVMTIIGFQAGKCGPYSVAQLRDDAGVETTVKTIDNAMRREIASSPASFIGQRLVCAYQCKMPSGKYRHITWDHLTEGGADR